MFSRMDEDSPKSHSQRIREHRKAERAEMSDTDKLLVFMRKNTKCTGTVTIPADIERLPCGCLRPKYQAPDFREYALQKGRELTAAEKHKVLTASLRRDKEAATRFQQVTRDSTNVPWLHSCRRTLLVEEPKPTERVGNT